MNLNKVERDKLMDQAMKLAALDHEMNGRYANAPYTVGSRYKARIREYQGDGRTRAHRTFLELYQPEHCLGTVQLGEPESAQVYELPEASS